MTLQPSQRSLRRDLLRYSSSTSFGIVLVGVGIDRTTADGFPENDVGVTWIWDLESVDFDVFEGRDFLWERGRRERKGRQIRGRKD